MARDSVFVLGGCRSGKSRFAQESAVRLGGRVLFVATAEALDDDMRRRIDAHRQSRPGDWRTLEAPLRVGQAIRDGVGGADVVVVDCLTLLVSNVMGQCQVSGAGNESAVRDRLERELREFEDCVADSPATFITVSNEVGTGIVPPSDAGRLYRDLLGWTNQRMAAAATQVYLMVAGIALRIDGAGRTLGI